jgi:Cytochrome C oxidase subunit II, periplasmic domain
MSRSLSVCRRLLFASALFGSPMLSLNVSFANPPSPSRSQTSGCIAPGNDPFRSVAEIKKEVDCAAEAFRKQEGSARPGPALWILAERNRLENRYALDGALQNGPECLVRQTVVLPQGQAITFRLTSGDAIYALSVPDLGVKADALPGRIESFVVTANQTGRFNGRLIPDRSASPPDGHAFTVQVLAPPDYTKWEARTLRAKGCGLR